MSILIKGMEMPTSCEDCPFYVEADEMLETNDWCYVLNRTLGRGTEKDIDGYDCPLIEIPPHGRVIDADEFLRTIRPINDDDVHKACTLDTVKKILFEKINEAPTVIPAEKEN